MEKKGNQNQMLSSHLEQVTLRGEVPEHLDQGVWEGVEVDVELALCWMLVNLEEVFRCSVPDGRVLTLDVVLGVRVW
jgi:hypothetical protein